MIRRLGNAHGGAGAGWLDEHGILKALFQILHNAVQTDIQIGIANQFPIRLNNIRLVSHQLGQCLIHGHSGSGNMGSHIGDAGQLQQALDGTVLAVCAVKHREHHINPFPHHTVALKVQQTLATNRRDGRPAVSGKTLPIAARKHRIIRTAKEDPIAALSDTHGENVVLLRVQAIQNILRRTQRNLMLRADAAEQNANT